MVSTAPRYEPAPWQLIVGLLLFLFLTVSSVFITQPSPTPPVSSTVLHQIDTASLQTANGWGSVALPSDWKNTPHGAQERTYSFQVVLDETLLPLRPSLYLAHFVQSAEILVNGVLNPTDLPIGARAYNWNRPALIGLDTRLLQPGTNRIEILLRNEAPYSEGFLSEIMVGPHDALLPLWREQYAARVGILQQLNTIQFWLSSAMAILYALRRREQSFGWLALGILFSAFYNLNFILDHLPISAAAWQAIVPFFLWLAILCLMFATSPTSSGKRPGLERLAFGCIAIGFGANVFLVLSDQQTGSIGYYIWTAVALAGCILIFAAVMRQHLTARRRAESLYLAGAGGLLFLFGLHDFLTWQGILQRDRTMMLSYGLFTLIVTQAWFVLVKFAGALDALETINADLDIKIKAREAELAQLHHQQISDTRDRAKATERERLMQDMHDGVGGRIMSAISLLEQNGIGVREAQEELRICLEDVRLIVESLDIEAGDFNALLASFRYQAEPRLRRQGVTMKWQVDALKVDLSPEAQLHMLRILQEAITNALRHSGADTIWLQAYKTRDHLCISLRDNGCGMPPEKDRHSGRGLGNIRRRTEAINATASWEHNNTGTTLAVKIPLNP